MKWPAIFVLSCIWLIAAGLSYCLSRSGSVFRVVAEWSLEQIEGLR